MTEQTAVATVDEREQRRRDLTVQQEALVSALDISVRSLDGRDLERWSARLPLHRQHQYVIPGASVKPEDLPPELQGAMWSGNKKAWGKEYSAGVRAEGYLWLNRLGIISFHTPETVHNREGKEVANPIHTMNYHYQREIGIGYAETGQMVMYVEDIEIDFQSAWEGERLRKLQGLLKSKARASSTGGSDPGGWDEEEAQSPAPASAPSVAEAGELLVRDEYGRPKLGPNGELSFRLPDKLEAEAMERLLTLRNYGGRQAKTIAQRRILMAATALRTLWTQIAISKPEPYTVYVAAVGWRDRMTPDERLARAREEAQRVFGTAKPTPEAEELDIAEAEFREEEVAVEEPAPERPAVVTTSVSEQVAAGVIPGITKGMPGEKLAKAVCGQHQPLDHVQPGMIGQFPCTEPPGHAGPHKSEDGIWPNS